MKRGWTWFDRRDGKRWTGVVFLTREAAQERLDWWEEHKYMATTELADELAHVEIREIVDVETDL